MKRLTLLLALIAGCHNGTAPEPSRGEFADLGAASGLRTPILIAPERIPTNSQGTPAIPRLIGYHVEWDTDDSVSVYVKVRHGQPERQRFGKEWTLQLFWDFGLPGGYGPIQADYVADLARDPYRIIYRTTSGGWAPHSNASFTAPGGMVQTVRIRIPDVYALGLADRWDLILHAGSMSRTYGPEDLP